MHRKLETCQLIHEIRDRCKLLEDKHHAILIEKEQAWNSRFTALLLEAGDHNTKYFQKIANHRKNCNTIWELEDRCGSKKKGLHQNLHRLGVSHFKELFTEKEHESIEDMLTFKTLPKNARTG
jgi:hypothetical protein